MELNGQDLTQTQFMQFFSDVNPDTLSDEALTEYNEKDIERALKESNVSAEIPRRFDRIRLEDFEWPDKDQIRSFGLDRKSDKVYLLFGGVGTGKTSVMCAVMHERAINEMSAGLYFSTMNLMPKLRSCRSFHASESEEAFFRRLSTVSLLCLDEIGTCENAVEERNFLRIIIANRYDNCLPTMISTNMSPNRFKLHLCGKDYPEASKEEINELCTQLNFTDPICNRLRANSITSRFLGESHRVKGN